MAKNISALEAIVIMGAPLIPAILMGALVAPAYLPERLSEVVVETYTAGVFVAGAIYFRLTTGSIFGNRNAEYLNNGRI